MFAAALGVVKGEVAVGVGLYCCQARCRRAFQQCCIRLSIVHSYWISADLIEILFCIAVVALILGLLTAMMSRALGRIQALENGLYTVGTRVGGVLPKGMVYC